MSVAKRSSPPFFRMRASRTKCIVLNEAPLPLPPLRPWVGIEQIDARKRIGWQPVDEVAGIAVMQTYVLEIVVIDGDQRLADGVEKPIGADETRVRMRQSLRDQMLGAAEADLEAQRRRSVRKQAGEVGRRRLAEIGRDLRQQILEQLDLPRAQRMALLAAEESALR